MKKIFSKLLGGALLFGLTMSLTSCEDVLGHWEKPSPTPITPTVEEVIKYGFKVTDLTGVDRTEAVTSLKMTNDDGLLVATAEVSAGKITITNKDLTTAAVTAAADFWFEATIGSQPYVAKVNIDPATLSPETDKTLEMATVGDVILADGKFYKAGTSGAMAKIAYLGDGDDSDATYNHGLALALSDASGYQKWCTQNTAICLGTGHQFSTVDAAKTDMAGIANTDALVGITPHNHGDNAAKAAREYNGGTHPSGTSAWFLPSAGQWDKMITTAGDYATLKTNANLQNTRYYSSSTEKGASSTWDFYSDDCNWYGGGKESSSYIVRACLAF